MPDPQITATVSTKRLHEVAASYGVVGLLNIARMARRQNEGYATQSRDFIWVYSAVDNATGKRTLLHKENR